MAARRSATGDVLPRTFAADVPPRTFAAAPGSPRARKHEEDCLELASHDDAMPVALLGAAATHGPSRAEACMAVADAAKEKGRSGRLSRFGRYSFSDAASDGGNLCVRCCAPVAALSRQAKVFLALICITAAGLGVGLPLGLASKTGVTVQLLTPTPPPVQYTLTITRDATGHLLMNGQFPGPVLSVEVGQTIEVTVVNNLANETTSVHWHGMFMQGTPWADGVPGVTQVRAAAGLSGCAVFLRAPHGSLPRAHSRHAAVPHSCCKSSRRGRRQHHAVQLHVAARRHLLVRRSCVCIASPRLTLTHARRTPRPAVLRRAPPRRAGITATGTSSTWMACTAR